MRRSSPDFRRKMASGATGGAMRMALRRPATAIVALMLAAALGCAARGPSAGVRQAGQEATAPRAVSSESAAAPRAAAGVSQAPFNEAADGARVVLSADAPLLYTAYEPRPDLLVVDLPGADLSAGFVLLRERDLSSPTSASSPSSRWARE